VTPIFRSLGLGAVLLATAVGSSAEPVFSSPNIDGGVSPAANFGFDLTPDGRYLLFRAAGDDMIAGDTNQIPDLIIRDRTTNTNELIAPGASLGAIPPNSGDYVSAVSADGRYIVFESSYNIIPGISSDVDQIYVRDRMLQQTFLVSTNDAGEPLEGTSFLPVISDDGRYVAFSSNATSIANGEDPPRTYLLDRQTGERRIVTRNRGGDTMGTIGNAAQVSMSGDGRFLAFADSPLLPEAQQLIHVYLYDRDDDSLRIVSRTPGGDLGNGSSGGAFISRDGRYIAFTSGASNLTGQPADDWQVLRVDRISGAIDKVDVDRLGNQESNGLSPPEDPPHVAQISATGRFIWFFADKRLTTGIPPFERHGAFMRDMDEQHTTVVNVDRDGHRAVVGVGPMSEDGRFIMMNSAALYPAGLSLPNEKLSSNAGPFLGDVFLQDLSPVDLEISLAPSTERGLVNATIENHSATQAAFVGLRIASTPAVRLDDSNPAVCATQLTPSECWNIVVPAGQTTTIGLVFEVTNVRSAIDVDITIEPNEPDPDMTNNSARISFDALPAPPPPPSNSGGGGGGGAVGWLGVALLLLLVSRRSRA
jgi:Tol biopolymer transport system component